MIMNFVCLIVFTFTTCLGGSNAYIPRFLHGRPRGGMLGAPRVSNPGSNTLPSPVTSEKWFVQPLNHFDQSNPAIWKQKYFVNEMHYKTGGPIFVSIGGEGPANPIWMNEGAWCDYAKTYNAYMILVEHRFYGDSHPTPDMSTPNLKYLSSEQALADLSMIIKYYKEKLPTSNKVVVFGGSYSGALAAWFRMKYPFLADGAIASSAPVLAKLNFKEYMEEVEKTLHLFDAINCAGNVNFANALITHLLKSQMGRDLLKKEFKLCTDIDNTKLRDVDTLFSNLAGNFLGVIQYNKDNRAFEGAKGTSITIEQLCHTMADSDLGSQLERYAHINSMMLDINGEKCLEFQYIPMIKDLQSINWNSSAAEGGRQWIYQTCTEFAYFQSSENGESFANFFPVQYMIQQCADIFGDEFTVGEIDAAVEATNTHYGGLGLKVTNVLFPNGSIDPWHALSILKDLNPTARAIFMNGTAHCANMYPAAATDLPVLKQARVEISKTIGLWIEA